MHVAVDSNILSYAEGLGDGGRRDRAAEVTRRLRQTGELHIPAQALGELFRALRRKAGRSPADAFAAVSMWSATSVVEASSVEAFGNAFKLAASHGFDIWDALVLSVAAGAGCDMLLSEDIHHGFLWDGCIVVDPFRDPIHPLLAPLITP
jgi:predicted nucleic acid-binding protein